MTLSGSFSTRSRSPSSIAAAPDRLSISARFVAFGLLSVIAAVLGVVETKPILIATGEAGLALTLLIFLYGRIAARGIVVGRVCPPRAYEGDTVLVTLYLTNRSRLPLFLVRIADAFQPADTPPQCVLLGTLGARRRPTPVTYAARCDRGRGRYDVGPVTLRISDPLGFFTRLRSFDVRSEILVLPRTFPIHALRLEGLRHSLDATTDTPARSGTSSTFMGTREYRHGDDIRNLHWRSSARWDRLVLKEFETISSRETSIFFDLSRESVKGILGFANLEVAIKIVASIAEHAAVRLLPFQVFARSKEDLFLPVETGPRHLEQSLETLAAVTADGDQSFPVMLMNRIPLLTPGSTVFLVLHNTNVNADGFGAAMAELDRRMIRTIAVVIDDATFVRLRGPAPEEAQRRLQTLVALLGAARAEVYRFSAGGSFRELFNAPEVSGEAR